jgi:hypothetical protein
MNKNGMRDFQVNKRKGKILDFVDSDQSETDETNTSENENILPELLEEISSVLEAIIRQNKNGKNTENKYIEIFYTQEPSISIYDYLDRIQKYLNVNNSTIILSLIYIDRICKEKGIKLRKNNIHRILFTSIVLSIKYNEDKFCKNSFYAKVGGISVKELTKLENAFLKLIEFKLFVSDDLFQKYYSYLFCTNKLEHK